MTNALAYKIALLTTTVNNIVSLFTTVKIIIVEASGFNVIKIFYGKIINVHNKLEYLSLAGLSILV